MSLAVAARLASIDVSRDDAQHAARIELSRHRYDAAKPPLVYRLLGRALRFLFRELSQASTHVPGGKAGLLVLLGVVALGVTAVLYRLGPLARRVAPGAVFGEDAELTADGHRALAEEAAAAGRWADAVRERLRAVVRELEARGVIDPRPARTAGEVATEGGAQLPGLAGQLRAGATVFDEVWYGDRTADARAYRVLADLDAAVRTGRPVNA